MLPEIVTHGGFEYRIGDESFSQTAAKADCESWNGNLTTVASTAENDFLKNFTSNEYNCNGTAYVNGIHLLLVLPVYGLL